LGGRVALQRRTAVVALLVVLVVAAAVACGGDADGLASGRPYSVDDGDPVDVVLTDENDGGRCMTVSGTGYRRVASCFGAEHAGRRAITS
jgi:ABC-type glycerol-3-phosphate transport system substrate-binding protein